MKNYNFKLVYKKNNNKQFLIRSLISSFVFALIIMLISGYFLGYRVFSVLGRSSEPDIHYGSIVVDYKVPLKDLKVGDYVTWSRSGNTFVTHKIISIDYDNDVIITSQTDYYSNGKPVNPDAPIKYKNIQGKVVLTIPYVGSIFLAFKNLVIYNNRINIIGIILVLLTFLTYYLFKRALHVDTFYLRGR